MKISVVVPTFNQGPYIEECLSSIRMQSHEDFEVIIQDALSDDSTEEICRRFELTDSRFRYYREKDMGQSDAINRGLTRSSGIYWTWLCSDDFYADGDALKTLCVCLDSANDELVVGAYGDARFVNEDGVPAESYGNAISNLTLEDFRLDWPLSQPSSLLRRQAVVDVGGVDPSLQLGMDLDLFLKILKHNRYLVYAPGLKVNVRLQPDSKSVKYRIKTAECALAIVRKHFEGSSVHSDSEYVREYLRATKQELYFDFLKFAKHLPFQEPIQRSFRKCKNNFGQYTERPGSLNLLVKNVCEGLLRLTGAVMWVVKTPIKFVIRLILHIRLDRQKPKDEAT